jgi:alpha-tubulin suppressor-like RCC1 family protein
MGDNLPVWSLGTNVYPLLVTVGGSFVCALLNDTGVSCAGSNAYGQLGGPSLETNTLAVLPPPYVDLGSGVVVSDVAAGGYHACAIFHNFTLKCWGDNTYGLWSYRVL